MNRTGCPTGARTICLCHYNATNYTVQQTCHFTCTTRRRHCPS